jgi:hypothetical protein
MVNTNHSPVISNTVLVTWLPIYNNPLLISHLPISLEPSPSPHAVDGQRVSSKQLAVDRCIKRATTPRPKNSHRREATTTGYGRLFQPLKSLECVKCRNAGI